MIRYYYEANWHKVYTDKDGHVQSDTIDDAYVSSFRKSDVIRSAKKLMKPYEDKVKYQGLCDRHYADRVDIAIEEYCFEDNGKTPTLQNLWNDFDLDWNSACERVYINNGKVRVI